MGSRAKGRLALAIAAAIAFVTFTTQQLLACENCAPGQNTQSLPANALPTYPEPTEATTEPVVLKKFTRQQSRTVRRTQPRNATLWRRASAAKYAARKTKATDQVRSETIAESVAKIAPLPAFTFANAKAELVEPTAARTEPAETTTVAAVAPAPETTASDAQAPVQPVSIELVSAEDFNELDKAAWEANQIPRLMQLTGTNSRAELRDDDSRWAQTSTIGKLFVVLGALLTIGSAIRMFMA